MLTPPAKIIRFVGLSLVTAALLCAQDWQTAESLSSVDFSGLTPAQKTLALKVMRTRDCSCGCGFKIAECRVKDPGCSYSRPLAAVVVAAVKQGKAEADVRAAVDSSPFAHPPGQDTRELLEQVTIPVQGAPVMGSPTARITIVEFSDFQCPFCIAAVPEVQALLAAFPSDIKLIFKQFPLDTHSQAATAAAAALAAQKQGKFWPMHDALFAAHGRLSAAVISAAAKQIGLDMKRFQADLDSPETRKAVLRDEEDGVKAGVQGTPTLFINGQRYNRSIRFDSLRFLIDTQLKAAPASVATLK